MENYKNKQIVTLTFCFSSATISTSKIITEYLLQPQCCIALSRPKRESNRRPSA